MKDRPILYNAPMVRAVLSGAKRQTRRVVVPTMTPPRVAPIRMEPWLIDGEQEIDDQGRPCWAGYHPDYPGEAKWFSCPWGMVGDRLWVRETWAVDAPLAQVRREYEDALPSMSHGPYFRADKVHENTGLTWRPSIHMPRWASRITQTITEVRVERVQDITDADALAEGVMEWAAVHCSQNPEDELYPRAYFELLWNSINKAPYRWDDNPFVWCISFEVTQ